MNKNQIIFIKTKMLILRVGLFSALATACIDNYAKSATIIHEEVKTYSLAFMREHLLCDGENYASLYSNQDELSSQLVAICEEDYRKHGCNEEYIANACSKVSLLSPFLSVLLDVQSKFNFYNLVRFENSEHDSRVPSSQHKTRGTSANSSDRLTLAFYKQIKLGEWIADIGCGFGLMACKVHILGANVHGYDSSGGALAKAKIFANVYSDFIKLRHDRGQLELTYVDILTSSFYLEKEYYNKILLRNVLNFMTPDQASNLLQKIQPGLKDDESKIYITMKAIDHKSFNAYTQAKIENRLYPSYIGYTTFDIVSDSSNLFGSKDFEYALCREKYEDIHPTDDSHFMNKETGNVERLHTYFYGEASSMRGLLVATGYDDIKMFYENITENITENRKMSLELTKEILDESGANLVLQITAKRKKGSVANF